MPYKLILFLLVLIIPSRGYLSAQVLDKSSAYPKSKYSNQDNHPIELENHSELVVQYEYTELSPECNLAETYITVLEVGNKISLFRSLNEYNIYKAFYDNQRILSFGEIMSLNNGIPYNQKIAKKNNSDSFEVFWGITLLLKYNDEAKQDWKFEDDEPMEFCGYACHKATTTFRGRTWTVWYADDLPVDAGPWKLHGLPGLIMYAQSDDALHTFKATTLEIDNNLPIFIDKSMIDNYERCPLEKGIALFNEYRTNSPAFELKYPGVYVSEDMLRLNEQLAIEHKDFEKCYHPIEVLQ